MTSRERSKGKLSSEAVVNDQFEENVISILKSSNQILVLVGAGISVSCGIPDFRSEKTGLYHILDTNELGLSSAEDLFDFETFKENPSSFYKFARHLYPGSVSPSLTHTFLAQLEKNNKLLRVYTQNIDGLEVLAGVPEKKVVYAHGSLTISKCLKCNSKFDASIMAEEVSLGLVPKCKKISRKAKQKDAMLKMLNSKDDRKSTLDEMVASSLKDTSPKSTRITRRKPQKIPPRSSSNEYSCDKYICGGLIKPGVTMFGEKLNSNVGKALECDRMKADAVIVMGTSLSVSPMSKVLRYLPPSIPRILINRNEVVLPKICADEIYSDDEEDTRDGYVFDHMLLGDCDNAVKEVIKRLHWGELSIVKRGHIGKSRKRKSCGTNAMKVVSDRCYAFTGAVIGDDGSNEFLPDIVHCDSCGNKIIDDYIMKCIDCFDFDLCKKCFHYESKKHFEGKHRFKKEAR